MVAAWENAKKGWIVAVFSLSSSIIGVVISQNMSDNSSEKKEFNEVLDNKADKAYVDQRLSEYDKVQAARYQGIYDMFSITNQQITELREDIREMNRRR